MVAYPGNIFQARQPFVVYLLPEELPNEEIQVMTLTAVSRCSECKAVVNIHWTACLVCRTIISPVPEVDAHQHTPDLPERKKDSVSLSESVSIAGVVAQDPPRPDLPSFPLLPHCFVTYTDSQGRLRGGWDERATSTVKQCHRVGANCEVELAHGGRIPIRAVRGVGKLSAEGCLIGAWSVREHGYDGRKQEDVL